MTPKSDRRAATLSISLTPELASEVAARVEGGLYSSASELFREALRLLLRQEGRRAEVVGGLSASAARFAETCDLMDLGRGLQLERVRREEPGLSRNEVRERLSQLADEQDVGPGLRASLERLSQLTVDEPEG